MLRSSRATVELSSDVDRYVHPFSLFWDGTDERVVE
jgi:hypothetical protein